MLVVVVVVDVKVVAAVVFGVSPGKGQGTNDRGGDIVVVLVERVASGPDFGIGVGVRLGLELGLGFGLEIVSFVVDVEDVDGTGGVMDMEAMGNRK